MSVVVVLVIYSGVEYVYVELNSSLELVVESVEIGVTVIADVLERFK